MSDFKKYRRTQIAEMRPITQDDLDDLEDGQIIFLLNGSYNIVSVSEQDRMNGSPKIGDMVARNPKNHHDQWLVSEQYFKDNFEDIV